MESKLHLHLFGSPQFTYQDKPLTGFVSNKARALLIYLAVTQRAHSRDALAELFWADTPTTKRRNLKKILSNLRNLAGVELIEESNQLVALDRAHCWVDVGEFEELSAGSAHVNPIDTLDRAAALYQDGFLTGFNLSLSYEFEAWALSEQTRLKTAMVEALRRLAEEYARRNDLPQAITHVRRLLQLEPWREEAHQQYMTLLAQDGQRSAALAHFAICEAILAEELGAPPSEETVALYQRLQRQDEGKYGVDTPKPARFTTKADYTLVGRAAEWATLHTCWQTLSRPHFVCISGEAGIGKTRLAEELLMVAERAGQRAARARYHAIQGRLAYGPVADWLRTAAFQSALTQLDPIWLRELARLLPELLIQHPTLEPPQPMHEAWQRKQLFEALTHAFTQEQGPLLLILDDLQWCDVDTVEWIQYLLGQVTLPLLVVGTVRSDELATDHPLHRLRHQLQRNDQFTELALAPLTAAATGSLAVQVARQPLSDQWSAQIHTEMAGNPLFIIERVRMGVTEDAMPTKQATTDDAAQQPVLIPPKVYSVIQARLAQLSPAALLLAQVGATVGRAFAVTLLAQATEQPEEAVLNGLDELWQRRIIREVDGLQYDFNHDRIRDVAYGEINPIKRRLLHRQVVDTLQIIHHAEIGLVSGQIAHHHEHAGQWVDAITYYQRAAHVADELHAYHEKIRCLASGIALIQELPDRLCYVEQELSMLQEQFQAYLAIEGFPSAGAEKASRLMLALAELTQNEEARYHGLSGLRGIYQNRGDMPNGLHYARETLTLAERIGGDDKIGNAHNLLAATYFHSGHLVAAWSHFEKALALEWRNAPVRSVHTSWLLGFADQTKQRIAGEIASMREKGEPHNLCWTLHFAAQIDFLMQDFVAMGERHQEVDRLAAKHDLVFFTAHGHFFQGWFFANEGRGEEAMLAFETGIAARAEIEAKLFQPLWKTLVVDALLRVGQFTQASSLIDEAIKETEHTGEAFLTAELFRRKGDLLLQQTHAVTEAATHYQLAIETAQQQEAKILELRATIGLCRLWQQQDKAAEAYQLLAPVYGWFTEGFDTPDLLDAKLLLNELTP